jgi:hypothetical protein
VSQIAGVQALPEKGCLEKFKVQGSRFKIRGMPTMNFSYFTGGPKAH